MTVATSDDSVQTWTLSRLLITASRLVEHHNAEELRPYNLTHASFGVLALVSRGPVSQRHLAHATRVEEQTISKTVDRLERMGMVPREKDPDDPRRFLVTMTDVGRHAFRQATRHDHAEQALAGLPEAEQLRSALATLIEAMGGEEYVPAVEPET